MMLKVDDYFCFFNFYLANSKKIYKFVAKYTNYVCSK